jgi:hypothetical protein
LYWNVFRNPLQNFRAYVLGASDKNYWVCGREPVMTVQRNDLVPPEDGYQSCVLYGGELWLPRLFLSYSGKSFVWYVGHQPSGFWGSAGADELVGTLVLPPASLASSPSPALDTSASQAAAWQHKRSVSTLIGDLASPRRSSLVPYWCAPDSPDPPVQSERAASRDFDQFSANSGPNACSVQVMNTNIPQPVKA